MCGLISKTSWLLMKYPALSLVHLLIFHSTVLAVSSLNGTTEGNLPCSTGLFRQCEEGNCSCSCGQHYPAHIITCNGSRAFMLKYNCATYNFTKNILSVGSCLRMANITGNDTDYELLPEDINNLNTYMCSHLNRDGTLCGRCLPDHYLLAYSIHNTCASCPYVRWNWAKYITTAYLPLTVFYIIILVFNINTTSGYAFMVIFYCQTLAVPFRLRVLFYHLESNSSSQLIAGVKFFSSLYGIWNLNFFRPFYSGFCLGIGILPTLALDYAIAVYLLLLMVITHLLIVLYDRNNRVVTILWRPFRAVLSLFKRGWDIKTSLIDAFAILSNTRFLSVSFDLLYVGTEFQLHRDRVVKQHPLFLSPDIEYFGKEHLPYAILAIFMLFVFVVPQITLLFLYPFSFFQKFLNLFPFRWYVLHTFMDSFQGCYRNRTQHGTRDCRWFSSLFFALRFCHYILIFAVQEGVIEHLLVASVMMFVLIVLARWQPFKSSYPYLNTINIAFLTSITLVSICWSALRYSYYVAPSYTPVLIFVLMLLTMAPVFYAISVLSYITYKQMRVLVRYFKPRIEGGTDDDLLPHRINDPGQYPRENLADFTAQAN